MESPQIAQGHEAWNKHKLKLIGQKLPFKLKEIWATHKPSVADWR